MKSTWSKAGSAAVTIAKDLAGPIVRAITSTAPHKCDPSGWYCDCARRREINTNTGERRQWIKPRKGWFRR